MTVPLILLAIPSIFAGLLIGRIVFGDYFGDSIAILPQHDGARGALAGLPRRPRDDHARPLHDAVLARDRGHRRGVLPVHPAARTSPGVLRAKLGLLDPHPREQVRLRRALPEALRRRRGQGRDRAVEGRRRRRHRRRAGERLGEDGRRARAAGARVPDRLHLPVRVHHDHRAVRAAQPVAPAHRVSPCRPQTPLAEPLDLGPDPGGAVVHGHRPRRERARRAGDRAPRRRRSASW